MHCLAGRSKITLFVCLMVWQHIICSVQMLLRMVMHIEGETKWGYQVDRAVMAYSQSWIIGMTSTNSCSVSGIAFESV